MNLLYDIAVRLTGLFLPVLAFFNKKLALFVSGRKETFNILARHIDKNDRVLWFHCASLGEFEQGRPVIEALRKDYPDRKIVLSFFSPSGYEVQKNYQYADAVVYLPLDTRKNAEKFIDLIHPEMVFFVKYEFWPNFLGVLYKRRIETLLVSGIFRKEQLFFKSYGGWMRKSLQAFSYFFVQDDNSVALLQDIGFSNASRSGDTRFDRVYQITKGDNRLEFVEKFKRDSFLLVAGSTWPEDEELLLHCINHQLPDDGKVLIAPHEIKPERISVLRKKITKKTALYSEGTIDVATRVLIVDAVGLLTRIYRYADTAYVGGGFGKEGVHNILEPAAFGVPVVMGPVYDKFKEAVDLIQRKGALVVSDQAGFNTVLNQLKENDKFRLKTGVICKKYIEEQKGATELILAYVHKKL